MVTFVDVVLDDLAIRYQPIPFQLLDAVAKETRRLAITSSRTGHRPTPALGAALSER